MKPPVKNSCSNALEAIDQSQVHFTLALGRAVNWFESLSVQTLADISQIYAPRARFKDPFNDVMGIEAIKSIYEHMFANLDDPRFLIDQTIVEHSRAFVSWTFTFTWRSRPFEISGGTRFLFNAEGCIEEHIDYWDVASELYAKLPVLGSVLRLLARRLAVKR